MTIFGKQLSEYFAFCKVFLVLILVVGLARLALSLGGAPTSLAKWISISAVAWIGVVYYAIRVHTTGFGSYKHLLPICVLMGVTAQVVIVAGIILAIFTGQDNIFSVPEYSFGTDGKTWLHVGAHLLLGTTIGPLISWLVGSVIMFATRKVVAGDTNGRASARA